MEVFKTILEVVGALLLLAMMFMTILVLVKNSNGLKELPIIGGGGGYLFDSIKWIGVIWVIAIVIFNLIQ